LAIRTVHSQRENKEPKVPCRYKKKSGAATSATIAVGFSLEALLLRHTAAAVSVISHWCREGEGSAFSWDRERRRRRRRGKKKSLATTVEQL